MGHSIFPTGTTKFDPTKTWSGYTLFNAKDEGKKALIERMDSRHGIHTVEAANKLGLGSREYEIINI